MSNVKFTYLSKPHQVLTFSLGCSPASLHCGQGTAKFVQNKIMLKPNLKLGSFVYVCGVLAWSCDIFKFIFFKNYSGCSKNGITDICTKKAQY